MGKETPLLDSIWACNFAVLGQGVYFIPESESGSWSSIQFLDFATGKVRKIFQLPRRAMWGFSVSPDGRSLLYTLPYMESGLMLVENFR